VNVVPKPQPVPFEQMSLRKDILLLSGILVVQQVLSLREDNWGKRYLELCERSHKVPEGRWFPRRQNCNVGSTKFAKRRHRQSGLLSVRAVPFTRARGFSTRTEIQVDYCGAATISRACEQLPRPRHTAYSHLLVRPNISRFLVVPSRRQLSWCHDILGISEQVTDRGKRPYVGTLRTGGQMSARADNLFPATKSASW
jgi:hypothetical protein